MKTINCAECKAEFNYEPPKGYPDKRKYCDPCDVKKNEQYNAAQASSEEPEVEKYPQKWDGSKTIPVDKPKSNGFEAHLSIETVRSNALASAIEWASKTHKDRDLMQLAKTFEQYILTGK